jgi:hypothetical protein
MPAYQVRISARKAGAIGVHGTIQRTYTILADNDDDAQNKARLKAYSEGLEHVRIYSVSQVP